MTTNNAQRRERALKLAEQLLDWGEHDADEGLIRHAMQLRDRIKTPMTMVLEKVPGASVTEKAAKIGITRQAYYAWLKGEYRPNLKQAKRLAALTGVSAEDIRSRV